MDHQLHVIFFPFMSQGHIVPTMDMAKLFSSRGIKTTIITTPINAPAVTKTIENTKHSGFQISIRLIKFPSVEVGLPEGCESMDQLTTSDMFAKFVNALFLLQEQLEQILQELSPDCLVADMFFPWATDVSAKFGIPRLVFHGLSLFALCCSENLRFYKPFKNVSADTEPFILNDFPHQIEFSKQQVPEFELGEGRPGFIELLKQVKESEAKSFGIVGNSFNELEQDYVDYFKKVWQRKVWLIGPLSLCNRQITSVGQHECLKWLDSKKPNSVVYACFGSVQHLTASQLYEIALGLEASGHQFIWVVKNRNKDSQDDEKWLPQGFGNRIKDRGLIIREWAPQVAILEHEATGAFITHCGWNSVLEAVSGGVPMVTWPTFAEQPFNEKLVTQVLKIGVPVGSPLLNRAVNEVKGYEVADAVKRVMEGEEALQMRNSANAFKKMAWKSIEEGGSSYNELSCLIEELRTYRHQQNKI